jgi:hypothetical protein
LYRGRHGAIAAEHLFHRSRNFAERGAGAGGINREREQIAAAACAFGQRTKRGLARVFIARVARTA